MEEDERTSYGSRSRSRSRTPGSGGGGGGGGGGGTPTPRGGVGSGRRRETDASRAADAAAAALFSGDPDAPRPPVPACATSITPGAPDVRATQPAMLAILDKMSKRDRLQTFRDPVTDDDAPGYSKVVPRSICWRSLRHGIARSRIRDWDGLAGEMDAMFAACRAYNGEASEWADQAAGVQTQAARMLQLARAGCTDMRGKISALLRETPVEWAVTKRYDAECDARLASGGGGGGGGAGGARRRRPTTAGEEAGGSPGPAGLSREGSEQPGTAADPYAGLGPGRWGGGLGGAAGRPRRVAGPRAARAEAQLEGEGLVCRADADPGLGNKRASFPRRAHAGAWAAGAGGLGRGHNGDGVALAGVPSFMPLGAGGGAAAAAALLSPAYYAASVARFTAGLPGRLRDAVLARVAAAGGGGGGKRLMG